MAAKAASRLTAPCAWTFFSPAQSAPCAGTSATWAGTSTRYYANSSPASKETACAAPLCTPPPAARPRPWPGRCRPQYYECEWGRQRRAPTSLAPPVHLSAPPVREIETVSSSTSSAHCLSLSKLRAEHWTIRWYDRGGAARKASKSSQQPAAAAGLLDLVQGRIAAAGIHRHYAVGQRQRTCPT
jgi:hypothetical protein